MHEGIKTQDEEHICRSRKGGLKYACLKPTTYLHSIQKYEDCSISNAQILTYCDLYLSCKLQIKSCSEMLRNVITHVSFKIVRNDHEHVAEYHTFL